MKIEKVRLETHNIDKLKGFYEKLPGIIKLDDEGSFSVGSSILEVADAQGEIHGNYHIAFEVHKGHLLALYEQLQAELTFITRDETVIFDIKNWNSKAVYFFDSDMNILEFIERDYAEENERPIRSIVEVGLALRNMKEMECLKLNTELDIFPGIVSEQFMPIGDEDGLFICVPKGRNWNPSIRASGFTPTTVIFEVNGKKKQLTYLNNGDINIEYLKNESNGKELVI